MTKGERCSFMTSKTVYQIASSSNLDKLERAQLSDARVIIGFLNSCLMDIVFYEADLQPLRLRSRYLLAKYFANLISYGDQHRISSYVRKIGTIIITLRESA
ncbi:hypothetical protein TNCV_2110371 [Trichonephila clavipes]|nr:hypothetical protein TNCV_2110371 [Trichonephila clavipes]